MHLGARLDGDNLVYFVADGPDDEGTTLVINKGGRDIEVATHVNNIVDQDERKKRFKLGEFRIFLYLRTNSRLPVLVLAGNIPGLGIYDLAPVPWGGLYCILTLIHDEIGDGRALAPNKPPMLQHVRRALLCRVFGAFTGWPWVIDREESDNKAAKNFYLKLVCDGSYFYARNMWGTREIRDTKYGVFVVERDGSVSVSSGDSLVFVGDRSNSIFFPLLSEHDSSSVSITYDVSTELDSILFPSVFDAFAAGVNRESTVLYSLAGLLASGKTELRKIAVNFWYYYDEDRAALKTIITDCKISPAQIASFLCDSFHDGPVSHYQLAALCRRHKRNIEIYVIAYDSHNNSNTVMYCAKRDKFVYSRSYQTIRILDVSTSSQTIFRLI